MDYRYPSTCPEGPRLASVRVSEISDSVADPSARGDEITAARDFLFQGFSAYPRAIYSLTNPS
ncbi:hypothetical protein CWR43_07000 [Rhizobium sullae]|uniref:Uncharacterized protein n=1 Tax=Rhizobium sullae TaxID=50338 RepID=A0A2N0DDB6_RHISU|nr:hypothetical protein CWR43_07000 [Rhizobium sullae]